MAADTSSAPAANTSVVEGAALSTEEAIAYAQRGRGERKRPTSGWGSLTPAERDVVRTAPVGRVERRTRRVVSLYRRGNPGRRTASSYSARVAARATNAASPV